VWRFGLDGSGAAWWRPPADAAGSRQALTGLAYDPVQDAIIVVESNNDRIYRVSISSGQTETLYAHGNRDFAPGFDGVTVTPDGRLYIAAVAQNGIATLTASGELEYIAGAFRGPNDVVYHAGRLYVANFDSFSLVVHLIQPRLPFSIDEIHLP
jgi:DNA-binding beta-propeller fold protein YncE